jgi:phosphate uptake regulator
MKSAREVIASDEEIDKLTKHMLKRTINAIEKEPDKVKEYFSIRSISKNLERIADSATNISRRCGLSYVQGR